MAEKKAKQEAVSVPVAKKATVKARTPVDKKAFVARKLKVLNNKANFGKFKDTIVDIQSILKQK